MGDVGRPPWVPSEKDRSQIEAMTGYGIRQADIARLFGVDVKTLRKHCRDELDTGALKANAQIGETIFQQARKGNIAAAIWWSKARMGWSELHKHRHGGDDDAPPMKHEHSALGILESRIAGIAARLAAHGVTGEPDGEPDKGTD